VLSSKELFLEAVGVPDITNEIAKLGNNITVHLKVTSDQTRNRRRLVKLQPARTDLMQSIVYQVVKDPSESVEIKRKAGIWGLYFRKRVAGPVSFNVWVQGQLKKGPTSVHDHDLHAVFRIKVTQKKQDNRDNIILD